MAPLCPLQQVPDASGQPQLGRHHRRAFRQRGHHGFTQRRGRCALYAQPRTTVNVRFGVIYMEDDYASAWAQVPTSVWASFWPNSNWYKGVINAEQGIYRSEERRV